MPSPDDCPADTVTGNSNQGGVRAFVINSENQSRALTVREKSEPSPSVAPGAGTYPRAFIVDGDGNRSRQPSVLDGDEPGMTVQAWHGRRSAHMPRALANGRVVSLTVRSLARLQSFPDSYQLPDKKSLAITIVGNAVPPLLAQRIVESEND